MLVRRFVASGGLALAPGLDGGDCCDIDDGDEVPCSDDGAAAIMFMLEAAELIDGKSLAMTSRPPFARGVQSRGLT